MSTTQLSAEWEYRILNEAKDYAKSDAGREVGYTHAARLYSTQLVAAQERINNLESYLDRIANGAAPYNDREAWSWIETARQLANEALSPNPVNSKEDEKERSMDEKR